MLGYGTKLVATISLFLLVLPILSNCSEPSECGKQISTPLTTTDWEIDFGKATIYSVLELSNNHLFFMGVLENENDVALYRPAIFLADETSKLLKTTSIPVTNGWLSSAIQISDGTIIAVGNSFDSPLVSSFDSHGTLIAYNELDSTGGNYLFDFSMFSDGTFLMHGQKSLSSEYGTNYIGLLVAFDQELNVVWTEEVDTLCSTSINHSTPFQDSVIVAITEHCEYYTGLPEAIATYYRYTPDGQSQEFLKLNDFYPHSLMSDNKEQIIIVGYQDAAGSDKGEFIYWLDQNGNIQRQIPFPEESPIGAGNGFLDDCNSLTFSASSLEDPNPASYLDDTYTGWIVNISYDGELMWQATTSFDGSPKVLTSTKASDGGYVIAGISTHDDTAFAVKFPSPYEQD